MYSSATSICFLSFIRMPYTRRLKRCIEKNYSEEEEEDLYFYISIEYSFSRSAKPDVSEFTIIYPVKFHIQSAAKRFYFYFVKTIFIMIANQCRGRHAGAATESLIFNSAFISSYKNFIRFIKLFNKIYIDAFFFKFTAIADLP